MKKAVFAYAVGAMLLAPAAGQAQEVITFNGFAAGDTIGQVFSTNLVGPVNVTGTSPALLGNVATAFDSSNPTCGDFDLGTPNEDFAGPGIGAGGESGSPFQNDEDLDIVAIIQEDTDCVPDDADLVGAEIELDFSPLGTVTIISMKVLDVEDPEDKDAEVDLYDAADALIGTFPIPAVGDNGLATMDLGPTMGVARMVVKLNGSGAIDDIEFEEEREGGEGCTPGYWKQPHHLDSWQGVAPADDFDTTFMTNVNWTGRCRGASGGDITLLQGLRCRSSGIYALARHGVAALLNAHQGDVEYGLTANEVKEIVKNALDSGNRATIIAAKNDLAALNEQGCPLN